MTRAVLAAVLVLSTALPGWSAEGRDVTFPSGSETVHAVLYVPAGKGPFPAVVVVHEWWGLVGWVKDQAAKLADAGYVALAVDLYRGRTARQPDEAHELMRGLPEDRAVRDLLAATKFLRSRADVKKTAVGAIGWCMGGGYAFMLAVNDPRLAAAVINYGHLSEEKATLQKIHAHVLGIFGGQDRGIPVADVKKFEEQMKALGKSVEIVIYPDAGHAFENPNNKDGYRESDAADAWKRTQAFLAKELKGK